MLKFLGDYGVTKTIIRQRDKKNDTVSNIFAANESDADIGYTKKHDFNVV